MRKDGVYITTGSAITNVSRVTEIVTLEDEETELRSMFKRGIGNVFPQIGKKCTLFMGADAKNRVHIWIREVDGNLIKDYQIPKAKN